MVVIPEYPIYAVRLIHRDGSVRRYSDLNGLIAQFGTHWLIANTVSHFGQYSHGETLIGTNRKTVGVIRHYSQADYMLRDAQDEPITHDQIIEAADKARRVRIELRLLRKRKRNWNGTGPVPDLRKWGNEKWFRRPKTHQVRRMALAADPSDAPPRAKRNTQNIPTSWDDLGRRDVNSNNWKRFRRYQYKRIANM